MKLYSYWRSSAAYRVRIALNLKGIEHELVPVHMLKNGGEQHLPDYRSINPQGLVPALVDGELRLGQSLAIIDYLEERCPHPSLYPEAPAQRARARQLALVIACDTHPLNNLRVLGYLKNTLEADQKAVDAWYRHWATEGLRTLEKLLGEQERQGPYCLGQRPTIADACLAPQVYNARRFDVPMDEFPTLAEIDAACMRLEAFQRAAPENQADAA